MRNGTMSEMKFGSEARTLTNERKIGVSKILCINNVSSLWTKEYSPLTTYLL
jgi:hypothetical protein